jgi:hypothetical protein
VLHPVDPRRLHEVWAWVRDGLLRVIDKTHDDWIPDDVYAEIRGGASALYLIYSGDERIGFVVVQVWPQYHNGPRLFVRALWGEPHSLAAVEDELMESLRVLARKHGASALRMNSPRRWDAAGWTLKQYIYETTV